MGAGSLDYVRLANDLNLIRGPGKSGDPAVAAAAQILPPPVRWAQDLPSPLPWERAEPHTGASDAAGVAGDTGDTGERLWPGSWEAAPACRFGALIQVGGRNAALQQCSPDPRSQAVIPGPDPMKGSKIINQSRRVATWRAQTSLSCTIPIPSPSYLLHRLAA